MTREGELYDLLDTCRELGILPGDMEAILEEGLLQILKEDDRIFIDAGQLERLHMIRRLTVDLAVNLSGVDVILEMRRKMIQMRREVDEIMEFLRRRLSADVAELLGEERFPMALGPGERFLAVEKGKSGKADGDKKGREE